MLTPATANELCEAIRAHPLVLAIGARTKPRLSEVPGDVALISTRGISGIIAYDPGEFTFTALAGTPLCEIRATLAERGQYLPFDPPLTDSGATIGGTVAAGLSGPGRFRYGGLRDFILAVQFADGTGQLLRGGAKVVKNAAGFDIPKFLAGSLGRYGVMAEVTLKVFPTPAAWLTIRVPCAGVAEAVDRIAAGAASRWELDAIDYLPAENCILARIGGPPDAKAALAGEIMNTWPGSESLPMDEAGALWSGLGEFRWAHADGVLAKIPITLSTLGGLASAVAAIPGARAHFSAAGNVAWVSLGSADLLPSFDAELKALALPGLVLRGERTPLGIGTHREAAIGGQVRAVFDPDRRFAPLA